MMFKKLSILLLLLIAPLAVFSYNSTNDENERIDGITDPLAHLPQEERALVMEFYGLDWKDSGTHKLPSSNSSLTLPEGYTMVVGKDAKRAREINNSMHVDDIEAVVYDDSFDHVVIFENIESGYVSIDDWSDIDPKSLLNSIIEDTEKTNSERRNKGIEELHVVGWLLEPTLNKDTHTVYWAIEGTSESEGSFVNSVALRLGRNGYEQITWITEKEAYVPFGGLLDIMLSAHSFDSGYRYQDFTLGDRVAEYGIASLVAASVGGKIIHATGLIVLLKKFWALAFAIFAGAFYKVKNFFKKEKKPLQMNT